MTKTKTIAKTSMTKTKSIAKTSMTKTSMTKTSISKTVITSMDSRKSNGRSDGWVVDEGGGGGKDGRVTINNSGVSRTLSNSGVGGGMFGLGGGDLRGIFRSNGSDSSEDRGDQRCRVKGGGNQRLGVEFWGNGETGILNTESESVSDVTNSLENSIGVNIGVSTVDSSIGVTDLLLDRVEVGVAIVQVSELILGVELAASVGDVGVGVVGISCVAVPSVGVTVPSVGGDHCGFVS
jgi:hypothetical protein